MTLKGWDYSLSVNHAGMDDDHQKLIENMKILHEAMKTGQQRVALAELIDDVNDYAQTHFLREEKYLREINHPDFMMQQQEHMAFLEKVRDFKRSFENGQIVLAIQMLPFLNDWFLNHIIKSDMKYK